MGRYAFDFDWIVFTAVLILLLLGFVTLLSIEPNFAYQQLLFGIVGLGLCAIFMRIDFQLYQYLDKYILAGSAFFLLMSFLGPNVRGATRWLELGVFRIQPSELVKPFFILGIASLLTQYPLINLKRAGFHLGLFIIYFMLIFRQPDLGNAIIFTSIWLGLIIMSGTSLHFLIAGATSPVVFIPLAIKLLHDYQKQRLLTFFNPLLDPRGAGYNAIQSMIAVGSGKLIGRGYGRGTQSLLKFLPERHTDFIFASFAEEFGFFGCAILLCLFFIILWKLLKQAEIHRPNQIAYLYIVGFFILLCTHVVINLGMNMGVLPITGITLPLVSYGGSSLIATLIGVGIYISALQKSRRDA